MKQSILSEKPYLCRTATKNPVSKYEVKKEFYIDTHRMDKNGKFA